MKSSTRNTTKLNTPILIVTAIVSMLVWVGIFYFLIAMEDLVIANPAVKEFMITGRYPLCICGAFAGLLLVIGLTVLVLSSLMLTFRADILSGKLGKGRVILLFLVGILVVGILAGVFQFIYQSDLVSGVKSSGDFIFLIDDSNSMLGNDPNLERYEALKDILEEQSPKTNFMVYSFATDVVVAHDMSAVEDGVPMLDRHQLGTSTCYNTALLRVIEDFESGEWTAKNPVVIFFTDGAANDIRFNSELAPVLSRFSAANIPIATVGMGDVDESMLTYIAEKTGGSFLDISEASAVGGAFRTAVNSFSSSRHLFSQRDTEGANLIYGAMRVVMVAILGTLVGLVVALCYGNSGSFSLIVTASAIKAILAGMILEIGIVALGLPESIMSFLAVLLLGTVIARYGDPAARKVNGKMEYVSTRSSRSSADAFDNFMD